MNQSQPETELEDSGFDETGNAAYDFLMKRDAAQEKAAE